MLKMLGWYTWLEIAGLALGHLLHIKCRTVKISYSESQWHIHIHLMALLSGTTQVSRYQKGRTNLDFTEARNSEWQWHQLGQMQVWPYSRQITTPASHHSVFYRPDALPATQPTASKHWRQHYTWVFRESQWVEGFLKQFPLVVLWCRLDHTASVTVKGRSYYAWIHDTHVCCNWTYWIK